MRGRVALASLLALGACATAPEEVVCVELDWVLTGLSDPESAVAGVEPGVIYVSNVAGEAAAKDGEGFISRVSTEGRMLDREWVTGLNAPKGMAVAGGRLYVSDIDEIVEIDIAAGAVAARYAAPDARFLNDVTVLPDGTVLASDSQTARIYALRDGAVETWLEDPMLQSVNGLMPDAGRLIVSTMQGKLMAVDPQSRAMTVLAEGLGDADGIASMGDGSYLVTEWRGRLFHVGADGQPFLLMDTRDDNILLNDIALLDNDVLLIANWRPGSLSAYRVFREQLQQQSAQRAQRLAELN